MPEKSDSKEADHEPIKWDHFGLFYLIQIFVITIFYWFGRNVNEGTREMLYANIVSFLIPFSFAILMILTYRGERRLTFTDKLFPLIGLLLVNLIWTVSLNYFNIFNRNISHQDFIKGIQITSLFEIVMLVIYLPVIALTKNKIIVKPKEREV